MTSSGGLQKKHCHYRRWKSGPGWCVCGSDHRDHVSEFVIKILKSKKKIINFETGLKKLIRETHRDFFILCFF